MRAEGWQSVPAAVVTVLASIALGAWIMTIDRSPSPTTVSRTARKAESVLTPLARRSAALMLGTHSRDVLFGLTAVPGGPIDVTVLPSDLKPVEAASLEAFVGLPGGGSPVRARSCATGCFRLDVPALSGKELRVLIRVRRPIGLAEADFRLPAHLPPSGGELQRRAARVMGSLRTLRIRQTLSSGKQTVRTDYAAHAPDRLQFSTSTGAETILIRNRRWDLEDGRWVPSPYPGTEAPTYFWEGATHPRIIGTGNVSGRPVTFLALFKADRSFPAWFRLAVARDGRVLSADMVAPGHFMTDWYRDFNGPVAIEPPG